MITQKGKEYVEKRKKVFEDNQILNDEDRPLTKKEVDAILSGFKNSNSGKSKRMDATVFSENDTVCLKPKKMERFLPKYKISQLGLLDQEILLKMAYQSKLRTKFSDKKKDALVRKFNRRIVRNYILSAILGGLVVGGVMNAPKVKTKLQTVIEKNFNQVR